MNGKQGSRRRSTRNKTIVFDSSIFLDDEELVSDNSIQSKFKMDTNDFPITQSNNSFQNSANYDVQNIENHQNKDNFNSMSNNYCQMVDSSSFAETNMNEIPQNLHNSQQTSLRPIIDNRSFSFVDLMNAFKSIEQKVSENSAMASKEAMRRITDGEDSKVKYNYMDSPGRGNFVSFPKIANNPFLQNDIKNNYNENPDIGYKKFKKL